MLAPLQFDLAAGTIAGHAVLGRPVAAIRSSLGPPDYTERYAHRIDLGYGVNAAPRVEVIFNGTAWALEFGDPTDVEAKLGRVLTVTPQTLSSAGSPRRTPRRFRLARSYHCDAKGSLRRLLQPGRTAANHLRQLTREPVHRPPAHEPSGGRMTGSFEAQAHVIRRCSRPVHDEIRPSYPPEAVRWMLGEAPVRVVDLGAGTGIFSRLVASLGHDVVAVEPDDGMRARLAESSPGVTVVAGSAEAVPLPDASVDAVVAAQAYHWFDNDEARLEIARVLRLGGVFAPIWNIRDESVA